MRKAIYTETGPVYGDEVISLYRRERNDRFELYLRFRRQNSENEVSLGAYGCREQARAAQADIRVFLNNLNPNQTDTYHGTSRTQTTY